MKATTKFYVRPDKAPTCEVVPDVRNRVDGNGRGEIIARFFAMGDKDGEFQVRMSREEALSLAADIVLKVARGKL
jgi:hypothetical protein